MMNREGAKAALASVADGEEPAILEPPVLTHLTAADVPSGARFQIGKMDKGVIHLEWEGTFHVEEGRLVGEAEHLWTRKYWYEPIGLEQYLDLVRRAVETRHRTHGDVTLLDHDDDGAYIHLTYRILTDDTGLAAGYATAQKIAREVEEAARNAADEVGMRIAEVAARLSGWGAESLDTLADAVDTAATSDDKGRALEELCSRLFETVPGFLVSQRIRTETEEIDILVVNGSGEPRFAREQAIILAECKNWSGRCGKNELVLFQQKIANRNRRCSLGFLVSWNGFSTTLSKELLRGSHEDLLIVPVTGEDVRQAVRGRDFSKVLLRCWGKAVML